MQMSSKSEQIDVVYICGMRRLDPEEWMFSEFPVVVLPCHLSGYSRPESFWW
jgi:hypothetical protein